MARIHGDTEAGVPRVRLSLTGYRKLIMFLVVAAIAAAVPLTETQADVLTTLTFVGIGGNVAEHWKEALGEALAGRTKRTGGGGSDIPGQAQP